MSRDPMWQLNDCGNTTAMCGASRFLLFSEEREPPRPKAVASGLPLEIVGSDERNTPRDKPVASSYRLRSLG
jgi:hypothetical protein